MTTVALALGWGVFLAIWLFIVRIGWLQPRGIFFIGVLGSLLWTAALIVLLLRRALS